MGFLHAPELILLVIVALIIFGPKRLPEIGGALGKGIKEFRKGTSEVEEKVSGSHPVQIPPTQHNDVVVPERPVEAASVPRDAEVR